MKGKMAIIGSDDSVFAFKAVGVDAYSAFSPESAESLLKKIAKEYQIMEMLMRNHDIILTSEQLITHIWGWETDVDISVIWVHISNLRKKIERSGSDLRIRFVRNAGYVLEECNGQ